MTPPKALHAAIAVPFLYWGNLVLSSLLNPGYSNMRQQVSELGANAASHPMIFNGLILATGVAQLVGAYGYYQALRRLAVGPSLSGLSALVLTLFGVAVLMAGFFPLPNPLHGGKYLGIVVLLGPPLLVAALWRQPHTARINAYLVITTVLSLAILCLRLGFGAVVTAHNLGLFQRVDAFVSLLWIAVAACFLRRRVLEIQ